MVEYDVAQFEIESQCFIMIPVNSSIIAKSNREQLAFREKMKLCAEEAGMCGTVVPVWRGYTGKVKFLAPPELCDLLARLEWGVVMKRINTKLLCAESIELEG